MERYYLKEVMSWTIKQRYRLALEREILIKNGFENFKFKNEKDSDKCYLDGMIYTDKKNIVLM